MYIYELSMDTFLQNIENLITFIDETYEYCDTIPVEVYSNLSIAVPDDTGKQSWASMIWCNTYKLIECLDFTGAGILSELVGGLLNYYSDQHTTPPELQKGCANVIERFRITSLQLRSDLAAIHDNPEKHWNDTYTVPFGEKNTITVSEIAEAVFPNKYTEDFTQLIRIFSIYFRQEITKDKIPEVVKIVTYYMHSDNTFYAEDPSWPNARGNNGSAFLPAPPIRGNKYVVWGNVSGYYNNGHDEHDEDRYNVPYVISNVNIGDEADCKNTVSRFIQRSAPGAYLPIAYEYDCWVYYQYYLAPITDSWTSCRVVEDHFSEWLFIDDGFGNILNVDGVAYREDVFTKWNIEGSSGVKKNDSAFLSRNYMHIRKEDTNTSEQQWYYCIIL